MIAYILLFGVIVWIAFYFMGWGFAQKLNEDNEKK